MKVKTHKILILIQTHINSQTEALGEAFAFLKEKFEEVKTSSVYLAYNHPGIHKNPTGQLVFAATALTEQGAPEVQSILDRLAEENTKALEVFLLAYDDETRLSPQLTLPHNELHLRPQWLLPAAEIWGEYPHPVLGKPLHELAGAQDWGPWGQFYAQGEMLKEFSSKR